MSSFFLPASADVLGIIMIVFLLYLINRNDFMEKDKSKYYSFISCVTLVIICLEIISDFFDYMNSPDLRMAALIVNAVGFILMYAIPIMIAALYSEKILHKIKIVIFPIIVGSFLSILSIWNQGIFSVNSNGKYERENLFFISILILAYGYCVLFYAHKDMAREYDKTDKKYLWLLFAIMVVTSIIQGILPEMRVMWGGIAITELMYYIFMRELQFKFDTVTEVRNRNCFEQRIMDIHPDDSLFIVSFDVNNLKNVNDLSGHSEGDRLLRKSAKIIKDSYSECGTIYRIGGDEFIVIATNCTEEKILKAKKDLMEQINYIKTNYFKDFYIANAYTRFTTYYHKNINDCLKEVDKKMYEDKKKSKNHCK